MKRISLFALLFLLASFAWGGSNLSPAEYTVNVHVIASRMVPEAGPRFQRVEAIIDGKKYELESDRTPDMLLSLGDYRAKIVRDDHRVTYESYKMYEFLFSDQKTRRFIVVGQTE